MCVAVGTFSLAHLAKVHTWNPCHMYGAPPVMAQPAVLATPRGPLELATEDCAHDGALVAVVGRVQRSLHVLRKHIQHILKETAWRMGAHSSSSLQAQFFSTAQSLTMVSGALSGPYFCRRLLTACAITRPARTGVSMPLQL
eukprot:15472741-Alexandrium_andersonii.AAC.1